ncbi:tyrosine-type recombinase/integrase [Maridesulfovibrio bastinii]|uniref:tyrosine-type recombinase/integrase n=1 Tax=Maridesulfovibrio bastinii TaxID=47157 RepID=UPI000421B6A2|nr:tyrosine-type recombinase/integrase [Maridesulfovibrio bastinii]
MTLTATQVKNAKPKAKLYRIADQGGLCLEVKPTGKKFWRYRYRFDGKATMLTLGTYPEVSLADARIEHMEASRTLKNGINPKQAKNVKLAEAQAQNDTFELVARAWLKKNSESWTTKTYRTNEGRLSNHVFPYIGHLPISAISPKDILGLLQRIEAKGTLETAHRVASLCSQIFKYAVFINKVEIDPVQIVKGALPPITKSRKHRAALTDPMEVGKLLRYIEEYSGHYIVKQALRVGLYTFTRSKEIRGMKWDEIDFDRKEWRIPAERMKMRKPHIVPLSNQVLTILKEVKQLNNPSKFVFPSVVNNSSILSENTLNTAIRRMGYTKEQLCYHGFRGTCTTLLYETGWPKDMVERQLAHVQTNQVRAAYDHAQYMEERTRMMQIFSDYLDSLRDGGSVIPFKKRA